MKSLESVAVDRVGDTAEETSQITFTGQLRSLPNGVADEFTSKDGKNVVVKKVSNGVAILSGVAVNITNYPLAKDTGSFYIQLTGGGVESGVIGVDSASADGTLYYELATPITIQESDFAINGYLANGLLTTIDNQVNTFSVEGSAFNPTTEITYARNLSTALDGLVDVVEENRILIGNQNAINLTFDARLTAIEP